MLQKIIHQLNENDYSLLSLQMEESKADKYLALLNNYRSEKITDRELITRLDVNPSAFYTLKSRLSDKVQVFLYENATETRNKLIQNVAKIDHLVFNTPRETSIQILKKLEAELIVNDMPNVYKLFINKILFEKSVSGIFVAYSYQRIAIGPTLVPGKTSCYKAVSDMYKENSNGVYELENMRKTADSFFLHPSINFAINLTASICVKEIVFLLLNKLDYVLSYEGIVCINTLDMSGEITPIECASNCEICKK